MPGASSIHFQTGLQALDLPFYATLGANYRF
jgi:hypothetical protein